MTTWPPSRRGSAARISAGRRSASSTAGSRSAGSALREYWPHLGPLLAAVQQKYGHRQSAGELGARLRRQGEHLASRAVVFACFDGDVIIGFALAYQWAGELALRAVGFDYERLSGADEYAQLAVHAPLRYCYAAQAPPPASRHRVL